MTENSSALPDRAPKRRMSPLLSRGIAAVLAVLAVLALVAIVLELVWVRPRYLDFESEQQARNDAVRVAEQFTAQVNNYDNATIEQYRASVTPLLTTKFRTEFTKAMEDIVASVKQAEVKSEGDVVSSAVAGIDPDSAQVLVVADATVQTVFDTRARHFRWEVDLVEVDGTWLVDNFTPVG
jgi:Mce-associated membrane protein